MRKFLLAVARVMLALLMLAATKYLAAMVIVSTAPIVRVFFSQVFIGQMLWVLLSFWLFVFYVRFLRKNVI